MSIAYSRSQILGKSEFVQLIEFCPCVKENLTIKGIWDQIVFQNEFMKIDEFLH